MVGGGHRFAQSLRDIQSLELQRESLFQVHQIRPAHRLFDEFRILLGHGDALRGEQRLEERHIDLLQHIIGLRTVGIWIRSGENSHLLSRLAQFLHGAPRRTRQTVPFDIEVVNDE